MRLIYIISISFFIFNISWSQSSEKIFTISSDDQSFKVYESNASYYSLSCQKKPCLAKSVKIPKSIAKKINSQINFSNPGDKICELIGGKTFVARFPNRDEQSFCLFTDKSIVDCGTLYLKIKGENFK